MLRRPFSLVLILAFAPFAGGCGEEEEPTPKEKYGDDIQSVRVMIFRDGTVTRKLNEFRMNAGEYPTTEQGLGALIKRPKGLSPELWQGPYVESENDFTDKWSNQLRYACPGKTHPDDNKKYDLWSLGPDGVDGTDDDILNHNYR